MGEANMPRLLRSPFVLRLDRSPGHVDAVSEIQLALETSPRLILAISRTSLWQNVGSISGWALIVRCLRPIRVFEISYVRADLVYMWLKREYTLANLQRGDNFTAFAAADGNCAWLALYKRIRIRGGHWPIPLDALANIIAVARAHSRILALRSGRMFVLRRKTLKIYERGIKVLLEWLAESSA